MYGGDIVIPTRKKICNETKFTTLINYAKLSLGKEVIIFLEVIHMKKIITFMLMLIMLFSFTLTVNAEISPSGKPTDEKNQTVVPPSKGTTSPKTGESEVILYGFGMAAVVFASGAVVVRKKIV